MRALRAVLKAVDVCALEPGRAAQALVQKGATAKYDYVLQSMQEIPWGKWRDYNPEDTVRFYTLRLYEVGMINSTPQRIIAQGSDWRFLNQLKKELKDVLFQANGESGLPPTRHLYIQGPTVDSPMIGPTAPGRFIDNRIRR
jgi:hypothetical protein